MIILIFCNCGATIYFLKHIKKPFYMTQLPIYSLHFQQINSWEHKIGIFRIHIKTNCASVLKLMCHSCVLLIRNASSRDTLITYVCSRQRPFMSTGLLPPFLRTWKIGSVFVAYHLLSVCFYLWEAYCITTVWKATLALI